LKGNATNSLADSNLKENRRHSCSSATSPWWSYPLPYKNSHTLTCGTLELGVLSFFGRGDSLDPEACAGQSDLPWRVGVCCGC